MESITLTFDQFKSVIELNLPFIVKVFRNDLVIPEFDQFCDQVRVLYNDLKNNMDGSVSKKRFTNMNLQALDFLLLYVISVLLNIVYFYSLLLTFLNWQEHQKRNGVFLFVLWMANVFPLEMLMTSLQFNLQGK